MINADISLRTYIVYHHGLFAQGVRNVLEERCSMRVVGMESDVTKALKAIRSLQPEVIIIEECTGKHQPMRLGAFLHSAAAGRVVTLSMDHEFATVYQRNHTSVTDLGELVKAIQGCSTQATLGTDLQQGTPMTSPRPEVALMPEQGTGTLETRERKHLTRRGDGAEGESGKNPAKSRAR